MLSSWLRYDSYTLSTWNLTAKIKSLTSLLQTVTLLAADVHAWIYVVI